MHLVSSTLDVFDVFEHSAGDHQVGFGVRKGKLIGDIGYVCRVGNRVRRQLVW